LRTGIVEQQEVIKSWIRALLRELVLQYCSSSVANTKTSAKMSCRVPTWRPTLVIQLNGSVPDLN
jgi:hypothetical protein